MNNLSRVALFIPILMLCGFFWNFPSWEQINATLLQKYPTVNNIDGAYLQTLLLKSEHIILIDVREEKEFAISHLPNALNITEVDAVHYPKDTLIVVYCSVGLRSAAFAQKLQKRGFTKVLNLRGSIFAWANSGYILRRGEKTVNVVHPYNKNWGKLLKDELHQYSLPADQGMY